MAGIQQALEGLCSLRSRRLAGTRTCAGWSSPGATSIVGHYAYLIAVSVYAVRRRRRKGGSSSSSSHGSYRPRWSLRSRAFSETATAASEFFLWTNVVRIVLVSAAAVGVFLDASPAVVYVLAVAATIATTPFRSAQAALTPSLARNPGRAHCSECGSGRGVEGVAVFLGPALAGLAACGRENRRRVRADRAPPRVLAALHPSHQKRSNGAPQGRDRSLHDHVRSACRLQGDRPAPRRFASCSD